MLRRQGIALASHLAEAKLEAHGLPTNLPRLVPPPSSHKGSAVEASPRPSRRLPVLPPSCPAVAPQLRMAAHISTPAHSRAPALSQL